MGVSSITSRAENNEVQASRQNPNQDGWYSRGVQSEAGCERLHPSAWISLQQTFNPVIKHDSIRSIFALLATRDMHMIQCDVRIAFLYGELDEENFMEQPGEGYEKDAMLVCRLK